MKRKLPLILTAGLALTAADHAAAGFPTLYGKINVTANKYDLEKLDFPVDKAAGSEGTTTVNGVTVNGTYKDTTYKAKGATSTADELNSNGLESNSSRIGVRGDFDISAALKAIYRLEYGVDVDNGSNSNGREFTQRNIFGGLQGNWGTVIAGKNDTPLKFIQTNTVQQSDIDRFNDLPLADIGTYLVGETRADNIVLYTSPILLGGLEINIGAVQGEETGVKVSDTNLQDDNKFASGRSISVSYGKADWYAALAVENNVASANAVRALGEVTLGPVKVGAIAQNAKRHAAEDSLPTVSNFVGSAVSTSLPYPTTSSSQTTPTVNPLSEWDGKNNANDYKEQKGYVLNAQWKIAGPWTAKAQYGTSTNVTNNETYDDVKVTATAVGVDYRLNENAKLLSYAASVKADGDDAISTKATVDKTVAVGFDLKF